MMVTDIESLPRGGMGGVVHTVGTVEDSEQKISQTKLILKCPLSKEFAHIVHINYIFTWKVDRDATNCQDGQDAEEHLTIIINQTKQGNCIIYYIYIYLYYILLYFIIFILILK